MREWADEEEKQGVFGGEKRGGDGEGGSQTDGEYNVWL